MVGGLIFMHLEQRLEEINNTLNNLDKQILNFSIVMQNIMNMETNVSRIDSSMYQDELYTVREVAKLIKTNTNYVYSLITAGLLPALKLGSYKIRRSSLIEFLNKYEGQDLTDINNIKPLNFREANQKLID